MLSTSDWNVTSYKDFAGLIRCYRSDECMIEIFWIWSTMIVLCIHKPDAQGHSLFKDKKILSKYKFMRIYFLSRNSSIIPERIRLREIECFQQHLFPRNHHWNKRFSCLKSKNKLFMKVSVFQVPRGMFRKKNGPLIVRLVERMLAFNYCFWREPQRVGG